MSSNINTKLTMTTNDEYYTPDQVWENIWDYLPICDVVFEPFYGKGHTWRWLDESCIYDTVLGKKGLNFFSHEASKLLKRCDYVISNPPFSLKYDVIKKLVASGKPFILLLPLSTINTIAFYDAFGDAIDHVSLIIPKGRIKFIFDGTVAKSPSFETVYVCWKTEIPKLVFLADKKN